MRRLVLLLLVSYLLVACAFVHKGSFSFVEASSLVFQGDLILTGDNVTVIEGSFDINGSIVIEENATLILKDGIINFTQTSDRQLNVTLQNPLNGNPRLKASNITLTSKHEFLIYLKQNSTSEISDSVLLGASTTLNDDSTMNIHNSTTGNPLTSSGSSSLNVSDSRIGSMMNYDSPTIVIFNSTVESLNISPYSANCTISKLKPGLFNSWNFISNCSVNMLPSGTTPNVTLIDTNVNYWRFGFYGTSTATVVDSTIGDSAVFGSTFLRVSDSSIATYLYARDSAVVLLINSTYSSIDGIDDSASINIAWHLDVHVVDSNGTDVPSANVSASYQNSTLVESEVTDSGGWVKLALIEKAMNNTGEYPVGDYTVEATYATRSNSTVVTVIGNEQIELRFEGFVIPELPSFLILSLFMTAMLLAIMIHKRKRKL